MTLRTRGDHIAVLLLVCAAMFLELTIADRSLAQVGRVGDG